METFTTIVAVIGLYTFPTIAIGRLLRAGSTLVYVLLPATIISLIWGYVDSRPSQGIRYGALSYAIVLALSAHIYLRFGAENVRLPIIGQLTGSVIRENVRYLIIAAAIVAVGLIYGCSHRYREIVDTARNRVLILDTWTGEAKTKY